MNMSTEDTIFVSIPAYRDPELSATVRSLFGNAQHAARVFVGICWQYSDDDAADNAAFVNGPLAERGDRVRLHRMPHTEATGPMLARHLAQRLWRGERFHLQVDSHMRFIRNWDTLLIDEYNELAERCACDPILTAYPAPYTLPSEAPERIYASILAASHFDEDGVLRLRSRQFTVAQLQHPVPSLFWAAGFSFGSARTIADAPYPSTLPHLFFGEEMLMLAKYYTHGFSFFAPTRNYALHLYDRSGREPPQYDPLIRRQSLMRLLAALEGNDGGDAELQMGERRDLAELWIGRLGVNLRERSISEKASSGGDGWRALPGVMLMDDFIAMLAMHARSASQ